MGTSSGYERNIPDLKEVPTAGNYMTGDADYNDGHCNADVRAGAMEGAAEAGPQPPAAGQTGQELVFLLGITLLPWSQAPLALCHRLKHVTLLQARLV